MLHAGSCPLTFQLKRTVAPPRHAPTFSKRPTVRLAVLHPLPSTSNSRGRMAGDRSILLGWMEVSFLSGLRNFCRKNKWVEAAMVIFLKVPRGNLWEIITWRLYCYRRPA